MPKFKTLFFPVIILAAILACDKKPSEPPPSPAGDKLRVLGYLFSNNNWHVTMQQVNWNLITDINLAFVQPDADGKFAANSNLATVVQTAHSKNVRIFFSIGGGNPPAHLASLMENDKRPAFVAGIVALAKQYNFDGVDIDLENALINQQYGTFVQEVATAMHAENKLVTAALASWNANQISDATLQHYDFINIMSYDKTGPWNLANPGQHSPYSMAESDFNYFKGRGVAAKKLFIGLPFYGYGFGTGAPESMTYKDIITTYPGSETKDVVDLPSGGKIYYNGIPTIKQKTAFAKNNNAGGVMIWQLLGDSNDDKSLLKSINQVIAQ